MSDKFRTFAMSYFCSFPPKVTFPGCSEEILFPLAKIRNIYHINNQLVIFLNLFRDYPYLDYADMVYYEFRGLIVRATEQEYRERMSRYLPKPIIGDM